MTTDWTVKENRDKATHTPADESTRCTYCGHELPAYECQARRESEEPTEEEVDRVAQALSNLYLHLVAVGGTNRVDWKTDARRVIASYEGRRWPV